MAALLHEVEVVERGKLVAAGVERLDDDALRVIQQEHDVAGLQRCAVPYGKTRGQARRNGFLGRADEGLCAVVAVLLQIDAADKPKPLAGGRGALQQHEAFRHTGVQDVQRVAHGCVNRVDALWWRGQVAFRENQAQGGRLMPDQRVYPLPVLRLGRVLVARDARPRRPIRIWARQQERPRHNADARKQVIAHGTSSFREKIHHLLL